MHRVGSVDIQLGAARQGADTVIDNIMVSESTCSDVSLSELKIKQGCTVRASNIVQTRH